MIISGDAQTAGGSFSNVTPQLARRPKFRETSGGAIMEMYLWDYLEWLDFLSENYDYIGNEVTDDGWDY